MAGVLVSEAQLSTMGNEALGLAIAPTLSRVPIPQTGGGGSGRGKSVASASMVASRNWAIINDPGTGPTGKRKAVASSVLGFGLVLPLQLLVWLYCGSGIAWPFLPRVQVGTTKTCSCQHFGSPGW
jgi:hypothetical protein